jgi:hypothetical protein
LNGMRVGLREDCSGGRLELYQIKKIGAGEV